ncbi:hypothetical protein AMD24_00049 [Candidatus Xiphinematobacter sp. Idaho Grape]|nr:hypothetical protein AMD24_00049 [Candidatus Xiphinematobacter sp. Idaho Grape]
MLAVRKVCEGIEGERAGTLRCNDHYPGENLLLLLSL